MTALTVYNKRNGLSAAFSWINTTIVALIAKQQPDTYPTTANEMLEFEMRQRDIGRSISDLAIARNIIRVHMDQQRVSQAVRDARQQYSEAGMKNRLVNKGWWSVNIVLPGGLHLKMATPYLRPTFKGLPGRRRGNGKRRAGGAGVFPVLKRLGIESGATPLTRSIVSRQTVLCSSYAEAQEQLIRDGLCLDIKAMVRLAKATGDKLVKLRNEAILDALEKPVPEGSMFEGQRIRISVDGGRARVRRTNHKARKGKNGRRPFSLDWREPRMITVDVLDDEGNMNHQWRPIYEISMGDADHVFDLLCGLLRLIGAHQAIQIVFVCDGAEWIWNRVEELFVRAEVPRERVELVLDYYHAVEHIVEALKACKNLTCQQRQAYINLFSNEMLEADGPVKVITKLKAFAYGRRGKAMNKEINYLVKHFEAGRLRYHELRASNVPIGSGVVESAVRRIINLRFKSAGQCWCEPGVDGQNSLEGLMYLRCILKSSRWDDAIVAQLEGKHFILPITGKSSSDEEERCNVA